MRSGHADDQHNDVFAIVIDTLNSVKVWYK